MKIDLSKVWTYLKIKRLPISLFFCCLYLPVTFHIAYIVLSKEYHFILYDLIIGVSFFMVIDTLIGHKLYDKKKKRKRT